MKKVGITLGIISIIYYLLIRGYAQSWFWLVLGLGIILLCGSYKHVKKYVPDKPRYIIIGMLLTVVLFFSSIAGRVIINFRGNEKVDLPYIIVLGAKSNSPVMRDRCDKAYEYLVDNPETKVIVSGGQGSDESISEAQAMKNYLLSRGVQESRIIMEDKSTSTEENLLNSLNVLASMNVDVRSNRFGIVSNDFHLKRARYLLYTLGIQNISCLSVRTNSVALPHYVIREVFALSKKIILG